ncbi:hypothetical protein QMP26_13205 [Enterocloster clostridioformis]
MILQVIGPAALPFILISLMSTSSLNPLMLFAIITEKLLAVHTAMKEASLHHGMFQQGADWFYSDGHTLAINRWVLINGGYRYFGGNEAMHTGWLHTNCGYYYRDNAGRILQDCWLEVDSSWYYFDHTYFMVTGWRKIDNTWYYFASDRYMLTDSATPDGYRVGIDGAWIA